jgi:hypothetical protein
VTVAYLLFSEDSSGILFPGHARAPSANRNVRKMMVRMEVEGCVAIRLDRCARVLRIGLCGVCSSYPENARRLIGDATKECEKRFFWCEFMGLEDMSCVSFC